MLGIFKFRRASEFYLMKPVAEKLKTYQSLRQFPQPSFVFAFYKKEFIQRILTS